MREFFGFYREYAQTGVHAASTAALTGFGLLIRYHEGFAVLAVLAYVCPLVYQYLRANRDVQSTDEDSEEGEDAGNAHGTGERDDARETGDTGDAAERTIEAEQPERTEQFEGELSPDWARCRVPVDTDLCDVVSHPAKDAVYAVGAGGLVGRFDGTWTELLSGGPSADGQTLTSVDATADGDGIWFAGDGGALGRFDTERGRHTDHSAPGDDTSNLTAIAVAGEGGDETIVVADGSGRVRRGRYDGGRVEWVAPVKPGSGSSITAVESETMTATGERLLYAVDTAGEVFRSRDADEWEAVGIDDASALNDVAIAEERQDEQERQEGRKTGETLVVGDDGTVHRYDGAVWTPVATASGTLTGVATSGASTAAEVAVAVGGNGTILERGASGWTEAQAPSNESLTAVCVARGSPFAVGDAGTVLARRGRRQRSE